MLREGKLDHFFESYGVIPGQAGDAQTGLFGDQGKNPVAGNHRLGAELFSAGDDPYDFPVFPDQVVHAVLRDQHGPFFFGLFGQPAVQDAAEDGEGMIGRAGELLGTEAQGGGGFRGHHRQEFDGDGPLEGFFLEEGGPQVRQIFFHRIQVEPAAGHVLGPGVVAPFDDHRLDSVLGQRVGGRKTGQTGAHDNDFKFLQRNL